MPDRVVARLRAWALGDTLQIVSVCVTESVCFAALQHQRIALTELGPAMSDPPPSPVATGRLEKTPFVHVILYIYERQASGTLIVRARSYGYRVLFQRGRAIAAQTPQPAAALNQALMPLAAAESGDFEFHQADLVGSGPDIVTGMFDPFAFVVEAVRKYARVDVISGMLGKYATGRLKLDASVNLSRLALTEAELRVVKSLQQGPAPLQTLLTQDCLSREAAERLVYTLLITRTLSRDEEQPGTPSARPQAEREHSALEPRGEHASSTSASTWSLRAVSDRVRPSGDAWRAIASRAAAIVTGRPGPPSDPAAAKPKDSQAPASSQTRAATLPSSAASQRPVSDPAPSVTPRSRPISRPLTHSVHSASMRPGSQSPSDRPALTARPARDQSARPSLPDISTLDDAGRFQRVELLCQRNAFDEALPIMRGLLERDRKNPRYLGLLSHVLYGRSTDTNFSKELIDTVNQTLRIDPDQLHALYTKARCYKRLGKEREALHYFRRTLMVDRNHLDAAREARLLMSRLRRS